MCITHGLDMIESMGADESEVSPCMPSTETTLLTNRSHCPVTVTRIMLLHLSTVLVGVLLLTSWVEGENDRPIIGVVCHEVKDTNRSFIGASYVKAIEAAGARVVPIFLWRSQEYYSHMVKSLNGVVFQGGNAKYDVKGGYFETAAKIFALARKLNYGGDHFPILGVCLGFEFLSIFSNNMDTGTLDSCRMEGVVVPLQFSQDFRNSSLFADASQEVIHTLAKQNVTVNYHHFCLRPETRLRHPWHVLSVNKDLDGKEFVSSMESGPMVAIQFHPEKNAYEWGDHVPSYKEALLANRHFYDWLVGEARKNDHSFSNRTEEQESLIYNYCPTYVGVRDTAFEQMYIFD